MQQTSIKLNITEGSLRACGEGNEKDEPFHFSEVERIQKQVGTDRIIQI